MTVLTDEVLTNNYMRLTLDGYVKTQHGNVAVLHRLNDNTFIVVNGITINEDNTCSWNFAYEYDIEDGSDAMALMMSKA